MGVAAILVMLPEPFLPRRFHTKFGFDWPSGLGEKMFENGRLTPTTDGRRSMDIL